VNQNNRANNCHGFFVVFKALDKCIGLINSVLSGSFKMLVIFVVMLFMVFISGTVEGNTLRSPQEDFVYEQETGAISWWVYALLITLTVINALVIFAWLWSRQLQRTVEKSNRDLRESEAKLIQAQQLAGIVQWEMDMKSERLYKVDDLFEYYNIKHNSDFLMVGDFMNIVHSDDRDFVKQTFENAIANKTIYEVEHRLLLSDGRIEWVNEFGKCEYDEEGNPVRIYGTTQNITDRKKAETDLKIALEKATEADRLKSTFLATMSHELRTPLNAIIGFSDLVSDKLAIEDIVNYSKIINSSGNHLLGIVEDLFDITLIEVGEIKIFKKDIFIQEILDDALEIIKIEQVKTKKEGVEIKLIVPEDGNNPIVNTDSSKFKQIIINLLKNALKFTQNGYIHFGYYLEEIQGTQMIKFYVKDSGIGIGKDQQNLIFDVFRQVEESSTRGYGGTGIGLSICKKLTGLLGGEIWVESEVGKGSTFFFTLPFNGNIEVTEKVQGTTDQVIDLKESLVLIVEDDEMSFEYLYIVLNNLGMKSIHRTNGKEAIEICKTNENIQLVLMDVNMPEMNGYYATKKIKEIRPTLPVIIQTAYAIAGDREKALEAGADDYIPKPIKKEQLAELVQSYL
jgi:signal transduction histidine kinase/CheY-like chemotaxis protein